MIADKLEQ